MPAVLPRRARRSHGSDLFDGARRSVRHGPVRPECRQRCRAGCYARTPAPAHLAFVDGTATLEREGQAETATRRGCRSYRAIDCRRRAGASRSCFPTASALAIDEFTTVELQDRALMRMTAGRVHADRRRASTIRPTRSAIKSTRLSASAATDGPGEYRVAMMNGRGELETELAVFRGYAALATDLGSTPRAPANAASRAMRSRRVSRCPSTPRGSTRSIGGRARGATRASARASSAICRAICYAVQQHLRSPRRVELPGSVWIRLVSHRVAADWRPYFYGYWSPVPAYGWTWVGYDVWGWPTHHYGRWGFAASRWFWVPERPGDRRGCRGRRRLDTSAGARSATAEAADFRSASRSAVHGDGWWSRRRTSATGTGIPFTTTPFRRPPFLRGRHSSFKPERRSRRQPRGRVPFRGLERAAPASAQAHNPPRVGSR